MTREPDHASETGALTPAFQPKPGSRPFSHATCLSRRHLKTHLGSDRCSTPLVQQPAPRTTQRREPLCAEPPGPQPTGEKLRAPHLPPLRSHVSSQRSAPDALASHVAGQRHQLPCTGHAPALTWCPSPTRPLPPLCHACQAPALPRGRGGQQGAGEGHVFCELGLFMLV